MENRQADPGYTPWPVNQGGHNFRFNNPSAGYWQQTSIHQLIITQNETYQFTKSPVADGDGPAPGN
jgi:hypothetical protein